jgi:methylated-DNA-[protein]-cysteine S-methyltransferase
MARVKKCAFCISIKEVALMEKCTAYMNSPVGVIRVTGDKDGISEVEFVDDARGISLNDKPDHPVVMECIEQLDQYFKGNRREFTINLTMNGTDFQKSVWSQLLKIPYGQTVSYRDIARSVENEKAVRAVGSANGKNRIGIIIPCHRVIGSNQKLTGYAGGLWRKEWLLNHEKGLGT